MDSEIKISEYLRLLEKWLKPSLKDIYSPPERQDLECYGTGYNSWGVQTNQKALAAWAVVGTSSELNEENAGLSQKAILEHVLKMLRFSLETHIEGSFKCLDGTRWGHTWISALGTERMMHAVDILEPYLTAKDKSLLENVLLSESDWLIDHYPIHADPDAFTGRNKPESNLWNGAMLHRTAMMYPEAMRADEYRQKGTKFLLNSISLPSDAQSKKIYDELPLSEWHVGGNFFESYAIHHHAYLNIGYMVICLSNIAMLHFSFKRRNKPAPQALYHHAEELWKLIKLCTFPDGRLCRIGGDTRARYCYCQDYALPMWLFIRDYFGDDECLDFERGWFDIVKMETAINADGLFLSECGRTLSQKSPLYYTRLEADRAVTLSMAAQWLNIDQALGEKTNSKNSFPVPANASWNDEFHGAMLVRNNKRIASWVWEAAEKPQGLCIPSTHSNMAEWRSNLFPAITGTGAKHENEVISHSDELFDGGFSTFGTVLTKSDQHLGEGHSKEVIAEQQVVFATLPDGATSICMQYAETIHRVFIESIKGLNLNIPNDIFNNNIRSYCTADRNFTTLSLPEKSELISLNSNWLEIDNALYVEILYGENLQIRRSDKREITIRDKERGGGFLYVDEIASPYINNGLKSYDKGEVLVDVGFLIQVNNAGISRTQSQGNVTVECSGKTRFAVITGVDNETYILLANFADQANTFQVHAEGITVALELSSEKTYHASSNDKIIIPCSPHAHILAKLFF